MKSLKRGKPISDAEVQAITKFGLWLFVDEREYFLPYKDFPWFEKATVAAIHHVVFHPPAHLHWPDLDVDLEVEALQDPQRYPLIYRQK